VHLKPNITFEQYESTLKAVRKSRPRRKPNQWIGSLVWAVIGFTIVFLYEIPATRIAGIALFVAFLVLWLAWKPYARSFQRRALRAIYDDQEHILQGNDMYVDEKGISGNWVGGNATYDFRWAAFYNLLDNPDAFLFLYSPCCWIRVPKDDLTTEQQQTVLAWYQASKGDAA
jgi:hypothetical protein